MEFTLQKCSIYPFVYSQGSEDLSELEFSSKIILPNSVLDTIIIHYQDKELPEPLCFKITSITGVSIYTSVHSFNSFGNNIYVTDKMLEKLCIESIGEKVVIELFQPPKGSKMCIQPYHDSFIKLDNPKKILETTIEKFYPILTKKNDIFIKYMDEIHKIRIIDLEPYETVLSYNTDIILEFLPSLETIERERLEQKRLKLERDKQKAQDNLKKKSSKKKFIPFSGKGYKLGGS